MGLGLAITPYSGGLAYAAGHEESDTTHTGGPKGPGGQGSGGNHSSGSHETDAEGGTDHEGGKGGPKKGAQDQGKGGSNAGGQRSGGDSGRPVWAKEGIPEVELGRLNVARSPDQVLDRAYAEALGSMSPSVLAFYGRNLEGMIEQLSLNWDEVSFIDSPLQNLALLRDALDGQSVLTTQGINPSNATLMAVFLGSASDKTIPVTTNTVLAVSAILDRPMTTAQAAALAADAERIRIAILAGHG
jgi:hypothetical protein